MKIFKIVHCHAWFAGTITDDGGVALEQGFTEQPRFVAAVLNRQLLALVTKRLVRRHCSDFDECDGCMMGVMEARPPSVESSSAVSDANTAT